VVEGLGYLGGVLAVTGVVLLVAHYWKDLELVGQLAISGVTAVALAGAGLAVPEHRAASMRRLRSFLWTLSTAAGAVLAATAAAEVVDPPPTAPVVAAGAATVAVVSGLMWWGRRRPVQQVLALGATAVAVGAGLVEPAGTTVAGLAVWAVGAALLAAGIGRRTVDPVIDVMVGSVALGVGAMVAVGDDPGIALLLPAGTGAAVVALALLRRLVTEVASIVAMCLVGSMTMLVALPPLLGTMAEHAAVATGSVLWCCGLAVAVVGVRRWTRGSIVLEVAGAAVMLIACAVVAAQEPGIATVAGLVTSLGLLAVSTLPERVTLSPVGALGLLAFVPWTIGWYFPGAGRVPVLISVSGLLIVGVAVLMARSGHRFGDELGGGRHHAAR
jgi:hypothetical protein